MDNVNGNLIWGRETNFGYRRNDNLSVIVEPDGYVILGMCNDRRPLIYKMSFSGTGPTIIRGFDNIYRPYKLIKDDDGNYIFIGASDAAERAYLTKINPSGTILYSKQYSAYNDMRFYDIAIDLDGNYLVSGSVKIGTTTYPMVVKINKSDGSVMWSGYWNGAPLNQAHNQLRGIEVVNFEKFIVSGYLGTDVEQHNGFIAAVDSIGSSNPCFGGNITNITVNNLSLVNGSYTISLADYTSINNISLNEYTFSILQEPDCEITPINYNEYKSCNFRIYGGKGFIEVKAKKLIKLGIYNMIGKKIKEVIIKEGRINLKTGIYFVRIDNEKLKVVVK